RTRLERRRLPGRVERPPRIARTGRPHPGDAGRTAVRRGDGDRGRRVHRGARDAPRHHRARRSSGGPGARRPDASHRRPHVIKWWQGRELSTVVILAVEVAFFAWYLWPAAGRSHPFLNAANAGLILKYSSIY